MIASVSGLPPSRAIIIAKRSRFSCKSADAFLRTAIR